MQNLPDSVSLYPGYKIVIRSNIMSALKYELNNPFNLDDDTAYQA